LSALLAVLCPLIWIYVLLLFGTIILSWFPVEPGSGLERVHLALRTVTEPVLGPVRRVLPPLRIGAGAVDLSPIVVFFGLRIVQVIIGC